MILLDTETDGLLGPTALPLDQQPKIIEIGLIKLAEPDLNIVDQLHLLLNPGRPLSEEITKITGLRDEDLRGKPSFARIYPQLVDFFLGEEMLVAHNLPFDRGVLAGELQRIDKLLAFPWPPKHVCTVEATQHLQDKYLKQEVLYEMATGRPADQTHRAHDDVSQLAEIVVWLRGEGLI